MAEYAPPTVCRSHSEPRNQAQLTSDRALLHQKYLRGVSNIQLRHACETHTDVARPSLGKAVWNDQYSEWFFVNIYTKKSQWDKPTEPIYPPGEEAPHGPPPTYHPPAGAVAGNLTGASEKSNFSSNNPYATSGPGSSNISEDEKLARKLQEEEEVRAGRLSGDNRGAANDFYNQPGQSQPGQYYGQQSASPYPQQAQTPYQDTTTQDKGKSKGLLGKLLGKASGHGSSSSHAYPPQQHGYGQQPGYGAAPGGYYGGGYQQRPMGYGMPAGGRRPGGGMGAGGAMALGAGGGLLGGALLGSAMADAGDGGNTYINNDYGDDGGDYGGDGGGDFGGDGGGDFGGGDF
ncbi:hypothetical protein BKA66DRAFT_313214 [Pyrenochaeta sp. MPI-SDFR-AT-0127]|nr:hypothetical protein BKA66DRAFT_313214 [Pyrenochaeta sp. MPI-SDFR-AT-0127]